MKNATIGRLLVTLGIGVCACLPAFASATQMATSQTYSTTLASPYYPGAFEGTLTLNTAADGSINGFYRPADTGRIGEVTGGTDGKTIWLDLPTLGRIHIDGKVDGPQITGSTLIYGRSYNFTATPSKATS